VEGGGIVTDSYLANHGLAPGLYTYVRGLPVECHGFTYLMHRVVTDVPSYSSKILVEAIDGPDAGMWFVVSVDNFRRRYEKIEDSSDE